MFATLFHWSDLGVLKAQSSFQEEREELTELLQRGSNMGSAGFAAAHLPLDARGSYKREGNCGTGRNIEVSSLGDNF